jgi:succinyl-diaminopimelate desuccinylase
MTAAFSPESLPQYAGHYQVRMVDFLRDLVRIPSVNGRHPEEALARRVLGEAESLGLTCRLIAKDPSRPNVLVSIGEGQAGFALIAHMDTVAEGSLERWKHGPFLAEIEGGKLYGRGAADNKAGIACGLYTLALLRDHSLVDLARERVILACVADEESGASSSLGVRYLLAQKLLPVQGAIYTYTSDIVCIGHRGLLRLDMKAEGQAVHAGILQWHQGRAGVNAVTGLADLLLRLEQLKITPAPQPGFEKLGCTITPGTKFHGGSYESIVPDEAMSTVDIRLLPGQAAASVLGKVDALAAEVEASRPGLKLSYTVKVNIPGASIPLNHPLVTLAQDYTQLFTGKRWLAEGAGPANEGYMLISAGIPTLCGFGPTGGGPHAPDEWVLLDSLPVTAGMFAGIIHDFLKRG